MALRARKSSLREALIRLLDAKHLVTTGTSYRCGGIACSAALYTVIAYDAVRLALADELAQILAGKHQGDGGVWVLDEHDVSVICKR